MKIKKTAYTFSVRLYGLLVVVISLPIVTYGQSSVSNYTDATNVTYSNSEEQALELENQIRDIYNKIYKSTIKIEVGPSAATGVLVSEDGYVLTAAHVVKAIGSMKATVRLYDGTQYPVKALGFDAERDYGLMKIEPDQKVVFSNLGDTSGLAKDEACLMLGYPDAASGNDNPAIMRIGFYKGITETDFLKTSCIMMPGDSGGPLFDLNGEVIGVCGFIRDGLDSNFYPSVDNVKKNWDRLVNGDKITEKRSGYYTDITDAPSKEEPFVLEGGKQSLIEVFSKKIQEFKESVVTIESAEKDTTRLTRGVIFDSEGYIVAKSSEVTNATITCTVNSGAKESTTVIGRDKANDVVVLKVQTKEKLKAIDLKQFADISSGQFIATLDESNIILSGIVGYPSRKVPNTNTGYLGARLNRASDKTIVTKSNEGTPAFKAGLLPDDEIVAFNSQTIGSRKELFAHLSNTYPDDKITLDIIRNNEKKKVDVILGDRSNFLSNYEKNHPGFNTKTNKRRDDFPKAFTHDMPLHVDQSGTLVINLKGEVVGMNMSRRNRPTSLALPLDQVARIVNTIIADK